jgi:putative addiction module component (TIGR02574 family)
MTKTDLEREILQLPLEERIELAEAIWESVEQASSQPPLPEWQRKLLDERIAADDESPDAGSAWDEVKRRILASL